MQTSVRIAPGSNVSPALLAPRGSDVVHARVRDELPQMLVEMRDRGNDGALARPVLPEELHVFAEVGWGVEV